MIYVADTNTIVSAMFWPRSLARRCLARAVRARWRLAISDEVFAEYAEVAARIRREHFPRHSPQPLLDWIHRKGLRLSRYLWAGGAAVIPRMTFSSRALWLRQRGISSHETEIY